MQKNLILDGQKTKSVNVLIFREREREREKERKYDDKLSIFFFSSDCNYKIVMIIYYPG